MSKGLCLQFWLELLATTGAVFSFALTIASHRWIELVFRVDPDHGSGLLEWLSVGLSVALAASCSGLARYEWRRAHSGPAWKPATGVAGGDVR
jgi:hypothetical protein